MFQQSLPAYYSVSIFSMSSHQAASYFPPLKYCCQITSGHSWVVNIFFSCSYFGLWRHGLMKAMVECQWPCHKGALAWSTPSRGQTGPKAKVWSTSSWKKQPKQTLVTRADLNTVDQEVEGKFWVKVQDIYRGRCIFSSLQDQLRFSLKCEQSLSSNLTVLEGEIILVKNPHLSAAMIDLYLISDLLQVRSFYYPAP